MIRYFKFRNDGACDGEAPSRTVKDGKLIIGYNKPTNEAMLLADGYVKYEGTKDSLHIRFENGAIVELPDEEPTPQAPSTVFTKLQIRRAMRKMGIENMLDNVIYSNGNVQNDWHDAKEIDLNDEVFKAALAQNGITDEYIQSIISNIEEQ